MSERKGRRGGGRAARQELRAQGNTETIPYLERQIPPVSVLDEASLVQLEENAEIIMSEVGIAFQEFPLALELFAEAGCTIEGDLVKFPQGPGPQDCYRERPCDLRSARSQSGT